MSRCADGKGRWTADRQLSTSDSRKAAAARVELDLRTTCPRDEEHLAGAGVATIRDLLTTW